MLPGLAISQKTAKLINFESFPSANIINPVTKKPDPQIRIIPFEVPNVGIFPSICAVIYQEQPTLIPPSVFLDRYDIKVTSKYILFKFKSTEPVIRYIKPVENKRAIVTPGEKLPIIPFQVHSISFPVTIDTGNTVNELTKQTASLLQIDKGQYPKRYEYEDDEGGGNFVEIYRVPITIPGAGVVLEMELGLTNSPYNVISAEQLLKRGFNITFTSEGISFSKGAQSRHHSSY